MVISRYTVASYIILSLSVFLFALLITQQVKAQSVDDQLDQIKQEAQQLRTQINNQDKQVVFYSDMQQGDSGGQVQKLQRVLNQDPQTQVAQSGPGSPGQETTYFGPKTYDAVVSFQEKYAEDILQPLELSEGTGYVGSATRDKLNSLYGNQADQNTQQEESNSDETPQESNVTNQDKTTDTTQSGVFEGADDVFNTAAEDISSETELFGGVTDTRPQTQQRLNTTATELFDGDCGLNQNVSSRQKEALKKVCQRMNTSYDELEEEAESGDETDKKVWDMVQKSRPEINLTGTDLDKTDNTVEVSWSIKGALRNCQRISDDTTDGWNMQMSTSQIRVGPAEGIPVLSDSGTAEVRLKDKESATLRLSCSRADGEEVKDSITFNLKKEDGDGGDGEQSTNSDIITISQNTIANTNDEYTVISWNTTGVEQCEKSGAWDGVLEKGSQGTMRVYGDDLSLGNHTYTVECNKQVGNSKTTDSVQLEVVSTDDESQDIGSKTQIRSFGAVGGAGGVLDIQSSNPTLAQADSSGSGGNSEGKIFGGRNLIFVPCTCNSDNDGIMILLNDVKDFGGFYFFDSSDTTLHRWANVVTPFVWTLGKYERSLKLCWQGDPPFCAPIPILKKIKRIGTGLLPDFDKDGEPW